MATELVIRSWCDVCLDAGEHTPGVTLNVPSLFDAPAFDVEACPQHSKAIRDALTELQPFGRKPGTGVPKTPGKGADETTGPLACPVCSTSFASVNACRSHLHRQHGKSLADVGLAEARVACPECGSAFPTNTGLTAHWRNTHPTTYARRKEAS